MLAGDFEPTEHQREQADISAHPSCEQCHGAGCLEAKCPVYGCCGLDKVVATPDGAVHEACLAAWNARGEASS